MGLFKNKVGRPSNDTIKKRRIIATVMIFAVVLAIGVCVFYTVNYFTGGDEESVVGVDQNISSGYLKDDPEINCPKCDMRWSEDGDGDLMHQNWWLPLTANNCEVEIWTDESVTLKIRTKYKDSVVSGKKKGISKYHYKVKVIAYDSSNKEISSTSKSTINKNTITQSLKVKNTLSYIKINIYDAVDKNKVVESKKFNVHSYYYKISDKNLNACILRAYNDQFKTSVTNLTESELAKITKLDCRDVKITNTKGIEKLTGLKTLTLMNNQLSDIDLSKNTKLEELWIPDNNLSKLNLTNNKKLKKLFLQMNKIKTLDLGSKSLTDINVSQNQLKKLDLSNYTNLTWVYATDNNLTELKLGKNTKLKQLFVYKNNLESIDLDKNTGLVEVNLNDNKLLKIKLDKNTKLETIELKNNKISSLDLSKNKKLKSVVITGNPIKKADVVVGKNTGIKIY